MGAQALDVEVLCDNRLSKILQRGRLASPHYL